MWPLASYHLASPAPAGPDFGEREGVWPLASYHLLRPRARWIDASSRRRAASMTKPTIPIAIIPDITIAVLMLLCPLTIR